MPLPGADGKTKVGKPKLRWQDEAQQDAERTGICNWRMVVLDKDCWWGLLQQARTSQDCNAPDNDNADSVLIVYFGY